MIFAQKRSFLDGLNDINANWLIFSFSGTEPTKESEFTFDITDIMAFANNCQSAQISNSSKVDDLYIKHLYNRTPLKQKGIDPDTMVVNCKSLDTNLHWSIEEHLNLLSGKPNEQSGNPPDVGSYLEFDLGYEIDVKQVVLKFYQVAGIPDFKLEYWDGSVWQEFFTSTARDTSEIAYPCNAVTSKIRFESTSTRTTDMRFSEFRIEANVIPVGQPSDESITWCALIPLAYSSFAAELKGTVPMLYCSATGPNAGGDVILSNVNPAKGEDVRLIAFSIKPDVIEF